MPSEDEVPADIVLPAIVEAPGYEGPERRMVGERRLILEPRAHERRAFGRRATDQVHWGHK